MPFLVSGESCLEGRLNLVSSKVAQPDQTHEPTVSLVICTRNRPGPLRNCLSAITKLRRVPNQIIVVDNTPGDKETEAIACQFHVDYATEPKAGLSRARNRAFGLSKC